MTFAIVSTILLLLAVIVVVYFLSMVVYIRGDYIRYHKSSQKQSPSYGKFLANCLSSREAILLTLRYNFTEDTDVLSTPYPKYAAQIVVGRILGSLYTVRSTDYAHKWQSNISPVNAAVIALAIIAQHLLTESQRQELEPRLAVLTSLPPSYRNNTSKYILEAVDEKFIINIIYATVRRFCENFAYLDEWEVDLNQNDIQKIRENIHPIIFTEILDAVLRTHPTHIYPINTHKELLNENPYDTKCVQEAPIV